MRDVYCLSTVGRIAAIAAVVALLGGALLLIAPAPATAQIQIGFCQGTFGRFEVFTVCFLVCCPGDLVNTLVCASTPPVNCGDASAVMDAVEAAVAGMMYGGMPIFGPPVSVPSPIPGQARSEFPLDPAYVAAGCCVVGGSVDFECGTMSLRIDTSDTPCAKGGGGGGGGGGGPIKLLISGPAPAGPSTLVVIFEGCPPVTVMLAGGESPAMVQALLLAALVGAGYTAFINISGDLEVTGDCFGGVPMGVDEFGLAAGLSMPLGILVCPPPEPVRTQTRTWGAVKSDYRN